MTISSENRVAGPYIGNDAATAFPFAFKVFSASDLQVVRTDSAGVESTLTLTTDYTVALNSNQDSNPGGTVTLLAALATGTKLTITSNITPLQATDLTNQGGFYPKVITNALDKLTILIQQIFNGLNRSIKLPISNSGDGTLPAGDRANTVVGFDALGALKLLAVQTGTSLVDLAASTGASLVGYRNVIANLYNRTVHKKLDELVSVFDYIDPTQHGYIMANDLAGQNMALVTAGIQAALDVLDGVKIPPFNYKVSSLNFHRSLQTVDMRGAMFVGGATVATDCVVRMSAEGGTYYGYDVNLNWNENYVCGTWWYNADTSSQYNTFFGMRHRYGRRGLIYGEKPGNASTAYAQSENQILGFKSRGVQNPFYGNHANGVLFFDNPIFVAHNEEWAVFAPLLTFDWTAASAFENFAGVVVANGGEIQKAGSNLGYAADLNTCRFVGTVIECANPLRQVGTDIWMIGCRHWMTVDNRSQYYVEPWVANANLNIIKGEFHRLPGVGAYSRNTLIDASAAAATNDINLIDCNVDEWALVQVTANCSLVKGGNPRIINTRLKQTAADANIYRLDNTRENLLEAKNIDHLCYTTAGWYLVNDYGGGTTFAVVADAPTGYLASCLELNATGNARAITADETSAATIKATGFRVRPGELYSIEAWLKSASGSNNLMITTKFYDASGAALTSGPNGNGEYFISDYAGAGLSGTAWGKALALATVPANAAFMAVGIRCNTTVGRFVDMRLRRAS